MALILWQLSPSPRGGAARFFGLFLLHGARLRCRLLTTGTVGKGPMERLWRRGSHERIHRGCIPFYQHISISGNVCLELRTWSSELRICPERHGTKLSAPTTKY